MKYAYVVAELSCTVTVCCYDPSSGELMKTDQVISTLSDNFDNSEQWEPRTVGTNEHKETMGANGNYQSERTCSGAVV